MKISHTFRPTAVERQRDRRRAVKALGRPLRGTEEVHHFTRTQLVICPDRAYHALLHRLAYDWKMEHDPAFVDAEVARIEATTARIMRECELLHKLLNTLGVSDEIINAELTRGGFAPYVRPA